MRWGWSDGLSWNKKNHAESKFSLEYSSQNSCLWERSKIPKVADKTRVTSVQEKLPPNPQHQQKKKRKKNRERETTGFVSACYLRQKGLRNQQRILDSRMPRTGGGHSNLLLKLQASKQS